MECLSEVGEFKYLSVLFMSEGKMDQEIDSWIGAAGGAKCNGKTFDLPVDLCSDPDLWSWTLGNHQKN